MAKKRNPSRRASPRAVPSTLTEKACEQVIELALMFKSYVALERLVSPEYADEQDVSVPPNRSELGALLQTLNDEMQRRIGALVDTMTDMHPQVGSQGT